MDLIWLYSVAKPLSPTPICCGVPLTVCSNIMLLLTSAFSSMLVSPTLSHLIVFTCILSLSFNSSINLFPVDAQSYLFLINVLNFPRHLSSTQCAQYLFPPILTPFTELISIYNFSYFAFASICTCYFIQ